MFSDKFEEIRKTHAGTFFINLDLSQKTEFSDQKKKKKDKKQKDGNKTLRIL